MDSTAGIRRASGRWLATAFWPGNTSRDLRFLLASLPAQLAAPAVIALPWLAIWAGRLPGKLTPLLGTAVVVVLLLAAIPALSAAERHLLRAFLGVGIPAPAAARRTSWRGLLAWLRAETTWRQLAYHVLVAPALAVCGLLMPALWAAGAGLAMIFAYAGAFKAFPPGHTVIYTYLTCWASW